MTSSANQERWAFALRLIEAHGDNVGNHILKCLTAMTDNKDEAGMQFWIGIADRVQKLAGPGDGPKQ